MTNKRLDGYVCLVTGAAKGIGRAIAIAAAREGACVVINYYTSQAEAHELEKMLKQEGCRALAVQADVSREKAVKGMFDYIEAQLGHVELLVNNAGISLRALLTETSETQWQKIMDTNLKGAFLCCQRALPAMIQKRHGRIVNISSVQGLCGASYESAYAASKGGLIALTKSLAAEVGPSGITVNALAPGPIKTSMLTSELDAEDCEYLKAQIPAGRFGDPEEIASACIYLMSREAGYINGLTLTIDGGWKI